jgi:hypothetical protein
MLDRTVKKILNGISGKCLVDGGGLCEEFLHSC